MNFGPLKAGEVEISLQFSDFTTVAYYINIGGYYPKSVEAGEVAPTMEVLWVPIKGTTKIFIELTQPLVISAHPSVTSD